MGTVEVLNTTKWNLDLFHSEIGFNVKHSIVTKLSGLFKEFKASIYTTGENFTTAEIDVWINPKSIRTGDDVRDAHLKSADFFDTENFREINFIGNTIERTNENHYALYGDLTIKRITKRIKLDVEFGGNIRRFLGLQKSRFYCKRQN